MSDYVSYSHIDSGTNNYGFAWLGKQGVWTFPAGRVAGRVASNGVWTYVPVPSKDQHEIQYWAGAAWGAMRMQIEALHHGTYRQTLIAAAAADAVTPLIIAGNLQSLIFTVTNYAGVPINLRLQSTNDGDIGIPT